MRCNLVLCQDSEPQTSVLSWGSYKRNIVQKKKKRICTLHLYSQCIGMLEVLLPSVELLLIIS